MFAFPLLFILVVLGLPVFGSELSLQGNIEQGALLLGKVAPGTHISVNGRRVHVDDTGVFLFGLGRDHPQTLIVEAKFTDGSAVRREKMVQQRQYEEQYIDDLPVKMVTPPLELLDRISHEASDVLRARSHLTLIPHIQEGLIWPVNGPITGVYGSRRILNGKPRTPHYGIDIAAPPGTPVKAMSNGIVRLASELYLSGKTIIIDHGHGISSSYLHLQSITVETNDNVGRGHVIGRVGETGRTKGPHLDWRINWFDIRLDPQLVDKLLGLESTKH